MKLNKIINQIDELINHNYEDSAEAAGLYYISVTEPGFIRKKIGKGFIYFDHNNNKIEDEKLISRIESLVIPPAWEEVWICRKASGHIQVTGRDAKGRKQYIYHPKWDEIRNTNKFNLMLKFAESLPLIREKVEQDLKQKNLTKQKVAAIIIKLLEETLIRVGNMEYAIANDSYGLTTLKNKHIEIEGNKIKFMFVGKSGKNWEVDVNNKKLAKLVKQCQELPGQNLFQYVGEEGNLQNITSNDINEYLKNIVDLGFTAKDFRTWGGTVTAAIELYHSGKAENEKDEKKKITQAIKNVAKALNNTLAVCRKYYIHPEIIESYKDGTLFTEMQKAEKKIETQPFALEKEEKAVLNILYKKLEMKLSA